MVISVRAVTNSKSRRLEKTGNAEYKAYVCSVPENNKANTELMNLLSVEFGVRKRQIKILKGLTKRDKVIKIDMDSS